MVTSGFDVLSRAVRQRRRELKLTQLEVCALAGVGAAFIYDLENGKRSLRLDKVLSVLDVLGLELRVASGRNGIVRDASWMPPDPQSTPDRGPSS